MEKTLVISILILYKFKTIYTIYNILYKDYLYESNERISRKNRSR